MPKPWEKHDQPQLPAMHCGSVNGRNLKALCSGYEDLLAGGVCAAAAYPGGRSSIVQTGFPRADARDDFDRALRQARRAQLAEWLRAGRSALTTCRCSAR